ncbi:MAG: hypothetical protein ABIU58_05470 [Ramlibacter sp.]
MRFAAVPSQQPPQQRKSAAAEFVRRLVTGQAPARLQPAPARAEDLPAELDQRVRLVGEW